jgi:hypothetical protein
VKRAKAFFIALFVAIILLGFSGTSLAFDLSKIASKPVEFVKYVAKKIGFGDGEEEKVSKDEAGKAFTVEDPPYNSNRVAETFYSDLYKIDFNRPVFHDDLNQFYGWQGNDEKVNFSYSSEDWYFRIGSRTGELFAPFSYESPNIQVWRTKMEYSAGLPWESFSKLNAELFIGSSFSRQQIPGLNGTGHDNIYEGLNLSPDSMDYGVRVNALVRDVEIGLYGWYSEDPGYLSSASMSLGAQGAFPDSFWGALDSGYFQRSSNLAATVSLELPFMSYFHQGVSPSVRFETAYRFGENRPENSTIFEEYDQWKIGMAYEGNNRIDWLNNYTITLDDLDDTGNLRQSYGSLSGNINANTYWFNMKLYTMFMYLYDRQTNGSMTVLNATYSPDWRWSYGIKANFYYGNKDWDKKELKNNSELVTTFTATYRWD